MVRLTDEGLVVAVRLTPKSGRDSIGEPKRDADGALRLRVSVTAPPANNQANEALIALMAKTWKVPKSAISIVAGWRGREKQVLIRGNADSLGSRIGPLIGVGHDD